MRRLAALAVFAAMAQAAPPRLAASGMDAVARGLSQEGLRHLYNLDYAQAQRTFQMLIKLEPDKPFSYLFDSGALWWQVSLEQNRFRNSPELRRRFERDVQKAIAGSKPLWSASDPADCADGQFIAGMSLGARGQWEILRHRWFKAYRSGKAAVSHLKECVKIQPEYYDADLGLGWFNYDVAHFSGFLRFLSRHLLGVHGDEEKGLEMMAISAQKGRYVPVQAKIVLMSIYVADRHDFKKALGLARELSRSYPHSPYFQILKAAFLYETGDTNASLAAGRRLFEMSRSSPTVFQPKMLSLVCSFAPDECPNRGQTELALRWFSRAIEEEEGAQGAQGVRPERRAADVQWLSMLHLFRGYSESILKLDRLARRDFDWVLAHPAFWDNHARAQACLEKPCRGDDILQYLTRLAHPGLKK